MLDKLQALCQACNLCRLGKASHDVKGTKIDTHVFSNMNPSKYVIIAQNPGFNECVNGVPLIGQSGKTLDTELEKHGVSRNQFYITNIVHCFTDGNRKPLLEEVSACHNIVAMEMRILRPKLVVALGALAFNTLCPDEKYSESMGTIKKVTYGGVNLNVMAVYHPSGMNLAVPERKAKFQKDIARVCALIKELDKEALALPSGPVEELQTSAIIPEVTELRIPTQ
jgi:uracil-DNA glycosylase family 4